MTKKLYYSEVDVMENAAHHLFNLETSNDGYQVIILAFELVKKDISTLHSETTWHACNDDFFGSKSSGKITIKNGKKFFKK